jgi:uncharacterized membrane protein
MTEHSPDDILRLTEQRIAERKAEAEAAQTAAKAARIGNERPWRYAFLAFVGVLLAALLFTPGWPVEAKMYAVVHGVCAQEHHIELAGMTFPLCARNSGIYMSFIFTMIYLWAIGRSRAGKLPPLSISLTLAAFVVIMAVDGFNSLFLDLGANNLYTPDNRLRTLTGMGMGITMAVVVHLVVNLSLRKDVEQQQRVLKNWWELLGILLINFLALVAIYGNLEFMFWPLAFIAFLGITGVLYIVSLLLTSLVMGYEGQVTNLAQLARPATIALIPTLIMLGGMSWLRYWLEGQGMIL